jgi:WD40 repeat protein
MVPENVAGQHEQDGGPAPPKPDEETCDTVLLPRGDSGAPADRPTAPLPATTIPGYQLLEELGRGGMGVVFKAHHLQLNRDVALKMILGGGLAGAQDTARFRAEAEAIAQIQHPNIIQIFEIGEHEGRLFLSLEYCGGGSLERRQRGTPLDATEAARLLLTLADAVEHAHRQGVIHRDLKPANVLLQDPALPLVPKITDFGLAKKVDGTGQSHTTTVVGSPSYMPPEQAVGGEVGPLADVYALGATLYELLTGRPPFRAANVLETLRQVQQEEPVSPRQLQCKIPRDLETICLKCLQKDPSRRYASAEELRADLERFLAGQPIRARPVGPAERAWRWCRRNPVVAGLTCLVVGLFLAGILAGSVALVLSETARQLAVDNAALEAAARTLAEQSDRESRERLTRLHVATGTRFLDANDRAAALCWYAHAWQADRPDPAGERNHRWRLASVMSAGPPLVGMCFHRGPVQDAAVAPAGDRLLSNGVGGREVYLWDPPAARLAVPPLRHDGEVRHACYGPDGRLVGTASADGTARVWEANSGKLLWTMPHPAGASWLAFRPGTTHLLTVDENGSVRGWDTLTGRPAGPLPRVEAKVWYAAFSEDGRLLVTADRDNHARIWNAATGKAQTPPLPHLALDRDEAFFHYKRWPTFNAAGTLLLTATKKTVHLWDAATGQARWPSARAFSENLAPMHLAFNRRGDKLVVSNGYVAHVLGTEDGKELLGLTHPRQNQYTTFSNDDRHLVSVSSGGAVHVWDTGTGRAVDQPLQCADFVRRVGFFPDNRQFFAASLDGTVRVWSLPTLDGLLTPYAVDCGRAHQRVAVTPQGTETYSPDGSLLARYGPSGLEVSPRKAGQDTLYRNPSPFRWARFTADGRRLLAADAVAVHCFVARTGRRFGQPIPLDGSLDRRAFAIHTARIFPDASGKRLATLDNPRAVSVWEVETGRRILGPLQNLGRHPQVFGPPESHGQISQPRLTPDGQTLVFGIPSSGILAAWDVASGKELYQLRKYSGNLHDLAVSADGAGVLAVSSNTTARLFDTRTGAPLGPALVHTGTVTDGDIAPDGVRVVTREGGIARIWDARNGDLLARFAGVPKSVEALWFSQDGRRVILSGQQQALVWQLPDLGIPAEHVPPLVRLLTGRDIDDANGLTQLDQHTFLDNPALYRKAWAAWRGVSDDARAQP